MEDLKGFHEMSVRVGVLAPSSWSEPSEDFLEWQSRCIGRTALAKRPPENEHIIPMLKVYIELEEDRVSYLLTFDEPPRVLFLDSAAYYAPYVPLTMTGIVKDDDGL